MRVAVVNQQSGGGATRVAQGTLDWGPPAGIEASYHPQGVVSEADLLAVLEAESPDVVHLHCWYGSFAHDLPLTISQRLPGVPQVITVHDVAPVNQYDEGCWECYRNPWCLGCPELGALRRWRPNYRVLERLRKRRLNRQMAAQLVLPSHWMQRRLARSEWARLPQEVIPYGIDTERFSPGPAERQRLGLGEGPLALFVGHMYAAADHRKGLPDLLAVWPKVRDALPEATLVVAGTVETADLPSGVKVLGNCGEDDLVALYRSADLLVLPTRGDNLPLAVLEAQSCGLAVVATRVGGVPEEVEEGRTGLLVPPRDDEALRAALRDLLDAPHRARELGASGRARTLELFSQELCARRHATLYGRLVGRQVSS